MLNTSKLVGFVGTTKPAEAKRFYEQCLGLQLLEESPFALVFVSGNTTVRVQKVQALATPPYTSLGWEVKDIASTVLHLTSKGVEFQYFEGLPQDEAGIWRTPDGSQVAWFRDPDGNTLSLTEHVAK
jgi:catechol 2,3-dioxygenase-like lactoylglutathione lyase family enzyme